MDSPIKRPRGDSKLDNMPGGRILELRDRMMAGALYSDLKDWLLTDCGVSTSDAALSAFWRRHCAPLLADRRRVASLKAEEIGRLASENPVDWDAAAIEKAKEVVFELLSSPTVDHDAAAKLLNVLLKKQSLENESRRIAMLEAKQREAKAKLEAVMAAGASKGGLTAETLKRIEEAANLL